MKRLLALSLWVVFFQCISLHAQQASSALFQDIKKLGVVGSVLYIAAHPDDENTRLITYLANERLLRTGYLSLTRGDGGQNLIGQEQGVELGLIRTQELLAARRIDGGEQFFTRAFDFGYSKTPVETFAIWDRDKILQDVVLVIRKFKPDVVITRFPATGEGGHGHHTASAILAEEAVEAAADPSKFPEQLALTGGAWKVNRLFWNTFNFGGNSTIREDQLKLDVGGYNSFLGKSYGEIAAQSRSQHKSQGFGVPISRGESMEYFKQLKGAPVKKDLLEEIPTSWSQRFQQLRIQKLVDSLVDGYNWQHPENSTIGLLKLYNALLEVNADGWGYQKTKEVMQLLLKVNGIYLEATSSQPYAVAGDSLQINCYMINRRGGSASVESISLLNEPEYSFAGKQKLFKNKGVTVSTKIQVPTTKAFSQPYWLQKPLLKGAYDVSDNALIGNPENSPAFSVLVDLKWENEAISYETISYEIPVNHKFTDPVKGELQWPLIVMPPVTLHPSDPLRLQLSSGQNKEDKVELTALSNRENLSIGFATSLLKKEMASVGSIKKEQRLQLNYPLTSFQGVDTIRFTATDSKGTIPLVDRSEIHYDHIPPLYYFKPAQVVVQPIEVKTAGKKIGYIPGAGDKIPEALQRMGYTVTLLDEPTLAKQSLQQFDAIITGVRAHNTQEWLNGYYDKLMKYVEQGGNYIVQYNTSNQIGPVKASIGPFPFVITRNRITDEKAIIRFLNPTHPAFTFPNQLNEHDFDGWVQERSIYHGVDTARKYEALMEMADPGEKADTGALLVAKVGKGWFTYTGLALFRQLPAGVPGAYRLLANLLALGKSTKN